jgi:hypothetical protein
MSTVHCQRRVARTRSVSCRLWFENPPSVPFWKGQRVVFGVWSADSNLEAIVANFFQEFGLPPCTPHTHFGFLSISIDIPGRVVACLIFRVSGVARLVVWFLTKPPPSLLHTCLRAQKSDDAAEQTKEKPATPVQPVPSPVDALDKETPPLFHQACALCSNSAISRVGILAQTLSMPILQMYH